MEINNFFEGKFGKINQGMCRLTVNGGIAVRCSNGFKTYDVKHETLTNVTNFCFNAGDDFFFIIPTTKVTLGDIILVDERPKCVLKAEPNRVEVIDYETSEVKTIIPERHIFMGNVYFYGKIVSLFSSAFNNVDRTKGIMKMMILSQLFGNNKSNIFGIDDSNNSLGQLAMMQMFMGDNKEFNPLESLFDSMSFDSLSFNIEDDNEAEAKCETE